ncbi:FecR family protein [Bradyrhizobium sp. dw_78]|uniref:FecR family protein n=1 Tax=Bradyrhizobium sp. dw_78 TaxID=2719793 RepID=UPI001BD339D9|nr:FecR family protein [Bradyrhizobium sp. dw_78]
MQDDAADPIMREALEWFVRLRDETVGDDDRRGFLAWLDRDESHAAAWARAQALWDRFDIAQPEFDKFRRSQAVLSRRHLLAGGMIVLAGGAGLYAFGRRDLFADHVTDIGERRTFTLADGSIVELGSYSALSVNFSASSRRLQLYRGEGFFDVAADPQRPFIVGAAGGAIKALGTRFDVKSVGDVVTVTVSEHMVQVSAGSTLGIDVGAGFQVSYGSGGIGGVSPADLDTSEAWRQDRIVFQDVPLRRVLAELERYRHGRIVLADSSIGDIPVTAIFDTRQADSALQTIAETLPIRVLQATNYIAIVYRAS